MKFNSLALLLLIVGFSGNRSLAQVTADFTANKTSGCSPLANVQFTDKSSPSDNVSWSWDLGNGENSIQQNPVTSYSNPGNYTVKLTATRNGLSTSKTMIIRVFKNPVADFSNTDNVTKACVPLLVRFEDHSTLGDTTMLSWLWQYGTGAYDIIRQPSYTYTSEGQYNVTLTVTDNHGCANTIIKNKYIDVASPPLVAFKPNPDVACHIPVTVNFTNQSVVKGAATYQWIAGTFASVQKDATFTFTKFDTVNVKLTVTDVDYKCSSENYVDYLVSQIKAIGTVKQGLKTINSSGSIVCVGTVNLASTSIPGNCMWIVDNIGVFSSYLPTTQYTFDQPGNHTIFLISSPGSGCADTLKWTFNVEKVIPQFSMTPVKSCQPSALVSFTNLSSVNAASFLWKFRDDSTSTSKNPPSVKYSVPNDNNNYEIHDAVVFPIKLYATTINGCTDSVVNSFTIRRPTALFTVDTVSGCAPLLVNFADKSISDTAIMFHDWDFGIGPVTHKTTETTAAYTYTAAGNYNARFWITNKSNCVDTSYIIPIKVGTLPGANFSIAPTTVYQSDPVTITDLTPIADYWLYTINGVSISSCANDKSPTFTSKPDIGTLTVKQVVGYNGCYAQTTKTITNNGPIAAYTYDIPACTNPYNYQFTGTYKVTGGVTTFNWDFGDATTSTLQSPAHPFPSSPENMDYIVKFTVSNGGHSDTAIDTVRVRKGIASFSAPAWACAMQPVSFLASASQPVTKLCQDKYIWNFSDTTAIIRTDADPVSHTFKYRGNYKVQLSAIHDNGCVDTVSHRIRIFRPKARLFPDKPGGCPYTEITFQDSSKIDVNPIVNYHMNFDDDVPENSAVPYHKFEHTYLAERIYSPYLKVTDNLGCYDSTIVSIGIEQPQVQLILPPSQTPGVLPNQICINTVITFTETALEMDSMKWNFGDGTISKSNVLSIDHAYATEGDFRAKIKVFKYGCSDSTELLIQTQRVDASYSLSDSVLYCLEPIKNIISTHLYPSHNIVSGEWDTGDGNNKFPYDTTAGRQSSIYTYTAPGKYSATLTLQTSFGCTDYKTKLIKIMSPGAKFSIDPSSKHACKKDLIKFAMYDTVNISKYSWTFGDGIGDSSRVDLKAQHRYTEGGSKYVHLALTNPSGCRYVVSDTITIDDVVAKFSVADTAGCDETPMVFTNLSTGNTMQSWDFGDGNLSTDVNPEHTFASSLLPYSVYLVATSANLCTDTFKRKMTVTKTPYLDIRDSCVNKKVLFHAKTTPGNQIIWWPSKGMSSVNSYDPVYSDTTATHTVGPFYCYAKVTNDVGGCFKIDSVLITRPQAIISPTSASIAIGDSVPISVTDTISIKSYKWEPAKFLSCTNCLSPTARPEESTLYYLILTDPGGCFTDSLRVSIFLDYTNLGLNFPDAFKPGSDINNNIFNMKGKGILEVLEFKIYNRWGNLVFSSTDKNRGWDGTYQGKDQPIDTYVYVATVRMGDANVKGGVIVKKKGTFLLIR